LNYARSVNQVILMGNLTRDPELRQTPNGQNVCGFGLALTVLTGRNPATAGSHRLIDIVTGTISGTVRIFGERPSVLVQAVCKAVAGARCQKRSKWKSWPTM